MSQTDGVYHGINDFKKFKDELALPPQAGGEGINEEPNSDLYDNTNILMFYSNSQDLKPGKGTGDIIKKSNRLDFVKLSGIKDWRRKMDDSWIDVQNPIIIDELPYASVMHYYQGSKYKKAHNDFSKLFSLSSESNISLDVSLSVSATSKSGKHKTKEGKILELRPPNIDIDIDFYPERNLKEREKAISARCQQNLEFKQILQYSLKAKLLHYIGSRNPELAIELMKVRSTIE
jgi:hypothetical protein